MIRLVVEVSRLVWCWGNLGCWKCTSHGVLCTLRLDSCAPWADILSTGEQQRLGFARLLYHSPAIAIMDESTSALDMDIQSKCLQACLDANMVLISVCGT